MSRVAPIVLLGVSVLNGCYRYVPVDASGLAPGTHVSVEVTSRGSANLQPKIGNNVTVLEGTVAASDAGGITVALLSVRRRGEVQPSTWSGESIRLASDEIAEVKGRQLSRGRTIAASAALGAAAVAVVIAIAKATGSASNGTGPRPTPTP